MWLLNFASCKHHHCRCILHFGLSWQYLLFVVEDFKKDMASICFHFFFLLGPCPLLPWLSLLLRTYVSLRLHHIFFTTSSVQSNAQLAIVSCLVHDYFSIISRSLHPLICDHYLPSPMPSCSAITCHNWSLNSASLYTLHSLPNRALFWETRWMSFSDAIFVDDRE